MPLETSEVSESQKRTLEAEGIVRGYLSTHRRYHSIATISKRTNLQNYEVEIAIGRIGLIVDPLTPSHNFDQGQKGGYENENLSRLIQTKEGLYKFATKRDLRRIEKTGRRVHHALRNFFSKNPDEYHTAEEIAAATHMPRDEVKTDLSRMQLYFDWGKVESVTKGVTEYYRKA